MVPISGPAFLNDQTNGAGILVIIDDGSGAGAIDLRDGSDSAYEPCGCGAATDQKEVIPQTYNFTASGDARTATLAIFVADIQDPASRIRPNALVLTVGGVMTTIPNPLQSPLFYDGAQWTTLVFDVDIPAGVTSVTVDLLSINDGVHAPASFTWVASALRVPETMGCDVEFDKTCCIPQPSGDFNCQDAKPIETLSVIWDGPSGVDVVSESGETFNNVANGDQIDLNVVGLGNDVDVTITGAVAGNSRFHVSCSDNEMNGPEDCGGDQGDGKKNESKYLNLWLFEGMGGATDQLVCTAPPPGGGPQTETACTPPEPVADGCDNAKPIETLSLVWDGPSGVDVASEGGEVFNNLANGDEITLNVVGLGNDVEVDVTGAVSGSSKFHVSCSDQQMDGSEDCGTAQGDGKKNESNQLNLWLFDGMTGTNGQVSCEPPGPMPPLFANECESFDGTVEYQYAVSNPNLTPMLVTVVDDPDVDDGDPTTIEIGSNVPVGAGETVMLFDTRVLTGTTTNKATAVADVGGQQCTAMDEVTVVAVLPPAVPFDCQDAKPIQTLTLIWGGPDSVDILSEGGQSIMGIANGDEITLDVEGLGNDVDVAISGAVSGKSVFHVSCSDGEMNGSEDCGNAQGNGKKNKNDKVNLWLFEGMAGGALGLDCTP
jgi:hypothetical protein